jgi:MerR family mercuric resistance operon transcriptional regulator
MNLTVGKLARAAGVGVETVRFYERRGLLEQPARKGSSYRVYTPAAVTRIQFIRRAQQLGFTLNEIAELIALEESASENCDAVRGRATDKISAIQRKIDDLEAMKGALQQMLTACPGSQPLSDCPIMSCLQFDQSCLPGSNGTHAA